MISKIDLISTYLRNASETQVGKRLLQASKFAFTLAVLSYLSYQTYSIGWINLWHSLPQTLWFYILWLIMYLQLPLTESLIYCNIWNISYIECTPALLRKKVLNQDVAGYSGEFYYYAWAKSHAGIGEDNILGAIKDNNIASGFAATTASLITIGLFLLTESIPVSEVFTGRDLGYALLFAALFFSLATIILYFRKSVFSLSSTLIYKIFTIHIVRNTGVFGLQVAQWWVVFPSAPLSVWATMLAIVIVASRLPFIPAKDWAAMSAILGISSFLDAPESVIAGLLLVHAGLNHGANFLVFSLLRFLGYYQNTSAKRVKNNSNTKI